MSPIDIFRPETYSRWYKNLYICHVMTLRNPRLVCQVLVSVLGVCLYTRTVIWETNTYNVKCSNGPLLYYKTEIVTCIYVLVLLVYHVSKLVQC